MKMKAAVCWICCIFLLTVLLSCAVKSRLDTMVIEINGKKFTVEVAIKQEDLSRGLMFRKKMAEDQGMLFVFERDRNMSFWMKNTSIPLSVAYISSEGIIREIYDMKPQSLASVESKYKTRYALELNQGAYERAGIKPGDKVVFPPEFTEMLP